jgi:myosin heavy subunit
LEKNRVCSHADGERTYHIFYQLLSTDESWRQSIWTGLIGKDIEDYKYIGPTTTKTIEGRTDAVKFIETSKALTDIGVTNDKFVTLMRALCIVIQLGNITFDVCPNDDDRAIITSTEEFIALSDLMGIAVDELTQALTERIMITRGEEFRVKLKASAAKDACDAFAKEIYSKTFLWLVRTINDATCAEMNIDIHPNEKQTDLEEVDYGIIGLLDIFGFESFEHNHFEQLCINYANEKLQQKAINDIFRETKNEYDREGIPLVEIEFADNEKVLYLIESKLGLLDLLNDECYKPKGTPEAFVQIVLQTHSASPYIIPPKRGVRNKFSVVHYAGPVEYEADNFVQGNQDSLPSDLAECAKKCSNEIIALHLSNDKSTNLACDKEFLSPKTMKNSSRPVVSNAVSPKIPANKPLSTRGRSKSEGASRSLQVKAIEQVSEGDAISVNSTRSDTVTPSSDVLPMEGQNKETDSNDCIIATKEAPQRKKILVKKVVKAPASGGRTLKRSNSGLIQATVWVKYQQQLMDLLDMLQETKSRYVRCIKPNPMKKPLIMDQITTVEQLRCSGIVSTVCLSRATFQNSIPNGVLRFRYQNTWDRDKFPAEVSEVVQGDDKLRSECAALLSCAFANYSQRVRQGGSPYVIGKTRTYFRKGALEYLESIRVLELDVMATSIQRRVRGMSVRARMAAIKRITPRIQRWYRALYAKRVVSNICRQSRFEKARSMFKSNAKTFVVKGSAFR